MTEDKLLTPLQVAQRLQVNERTVTQWLRHGEKIPEPLRRMRGLEFLE